VGGSTIIIISIMDGVDDNGDDCGYRRILSFSLSNGGDAITGIQGGNNEGGRRGEEPAIATAVPVVLVGVVDGM
jgi:hypothetical protein